MGPVNAVILYTSDIHGHVSPFKNRDKQEVGGIAYLATAVDRVRAEHPDELVLWVDAGDTLPNTPLSDLTRGKPIIDMMRAHGLTAMTVGNHEFDSTWGRTALCSAAATAGFPMLAANILQSDGSLLPNIAARASVESHGVRAEILGATTPDTAATTLPSNVAGLAFLSFEDTVDRHRPSIEAVQPDLKILVAHGGPEQVREAARRAGPGWVIVGGHTEDDVKAPVPMDGSLYVKAGTCGDQLGVLEVQVDPEAHRILGYRSTLVPIGPGHQEPDPEVVQIVHRAEEQLQPLLERHVGSTPRDLMRNHEGESLLDDLIADAMRISAGADVAVRNSTASRADIPAGPIRIRDLYAVIPWDEPVETVTLRQGDFVDALEHSVGGSADPHTLQVSGLKVRFDRGLPEGHRVVEARLDDGRALVADGQRVDEDREIRVAARPFLVQGGLGYDAFKRGRDPVQGEIIRMAVEQRLQDPQAVAGMRTGRIQFV